MKMIGWIGLTALALGLYLGLVWAPADVLMGEVSRIMYVHFPSWIASGMGYFAAFGFSIWYLKTRDLKWDRLAASGAEVGLLFNAIGIVTGSIWGRPTWGVWWTWDPRLTTAAILLCIFASYLLVRKFLEEPHARARIGAVVAIVGFLDVPITYFSVKWWRSLHQLPSTPATLDPQMVIALRVMMVAFVLIFLYLYRQRVHLAKLEQKQWDM